MNKSLDFYFDFISPYAYFAWPRVQQFCETHKLTLVAHPVVFGKLLDHWGQLGPAEMPPKREWLFKYCYRYAHQNEIPFDPPEMHPFNPLTALRLALPQVAGERQFDMITTLFQLAWADGGDPSSPEQVARVLSSAGFDKDTLLRRIGNADVKQALISETAEAVDRGVFGVPTMMLGNELFWGNDQFDHMALVVADQDPVTDEILDSVRGRKRGIDRKGHAPRPVK